MAQAKDVAIPKKSKFTFIAFEIRVQIYTNATMLQNKKAGGQKPLLPNFALIILLWQRNSLVI
jgi:hypothetical protein